jgi:electron transfer flavoprotein alpha subunit
MGKNIIILAEHLDGKISPAALEAAACARIIQTVSSLSVKIMISGRDIHKAAKRTAFETGVDVIGVLWEQSATPQAEIFKALAADFFVRLDPLYICMPHNSFGLEIAPGLAVKLNAGCISGVEKIIPLNDRLCFQRKIFNDKMVADMISNAARTVFTVQPGAFKPDQYGKPGKGTVEIVSPVFLEPPLRHLGIASSRQDISALTSAEVIVSAGNGIGKAENLDLIYQLAALFPKSSVAGSRPVCDRKWLPYHQQVGATGAAVRPKLYIACGISGASQHIAGMRDSRFIVSINTDPRAAVFQFSDVCVIEDLTSFIPELIEIYQKKTG